jgi:hypothetical protein
LLELQIFSMYVKLIQIRYRFGSLLFKEVMYLYRIVLFIHLNFIFLVGRSTRTQPADILVTFSLTYKFVVLIRKVYGTDLDQRTLGNGSRKIIQI